MWVADFTYVATWTGFVYVAFVLDALSRRILGWQAANCAPSTREWSNFSISLARCAMGLCQRLGSGSAWWE